MKPLQLCATSHDSAVVVAVAAVDPADVAAGIADVEAEDDDAVAGVDTVVDRKDCSYGTGCYDAGVFFGCGQRDMQKYEMSNSSSPHLQHQNR